MIRKLTLIFPVFIFVLVFSAGAQNKNAQAINSVARGMKKYSGERYLPKLEFIDTAGKKVTLDQFKGKNILVNLWFIGCMPCMNEIPFEREMYQRFRNDTSFTFLNICVRQQSFEQWRFFTRKYEMAGQHLMIDERIVDSLGGEKLARILKSNSFPTYILLDSNLEISGYGLPEPSTEIELDYILFHLKTGRSVADLYKEFMYNMEHFDSKNTGSKFNQWIKEFYKQEPMEYFAERSSR